MLNSIALCCAIVCNSSHSLLRSYKQVRDLYVQVLDMGWASQPTLNSTSTRKALTKASALRQRNLISPILFQFILFMKT